VAGSADVQRAVDSLASSLARPVLVEDTRHQPLWWSAQNDVDETRMRTILHRGVPPAAAALVIRMRLGSAAGPVRTPAVPEADMLPRWCVPLRTGRQLHGYLWVLDADGTVTEADLPGLVACAELAAATLAQDAATAAERDQRRAALLARLLVGPDEAAARDLIGLEGLGPDATVAVCAPRAAGGWDLDGGMSAHVNPPARRAATSGPAVPLADLRVAVQRAAVTRRVLRAGAQLPRPAWDALGSWRLIAAAPADLTVADLHPGADALARLPRPDLMITARAVLDHGGDIARTAAALHIHRTTLYYRLDRIEVLTGVNLKTGPDRDDLRMALRLAAYRRVID
jgi:PucR C-terminal helix-turn-helix domain